MLRFMSKLVLMAGLLLAAFSTLAFAQQRGTADEAVALTEKAVALIKAQGRDKAFATFNDPTASDYHAKDLYVFSLDFQGQMLAHGANAGLIHKNVFELKDTDGKHFVAEMIATAQTKGKGWVDYKWVDAQTKKIEPKSSYVEKVDDFLVGVGVYKP